MQVQQIGPVHKEILTKSRAARARLFGGKPVDTTLVQQLQEQARHLITEREFWKKNCQKAIDERDIARESLTQVQTHLRQGDTVSALIAVGLKVDGNATPVANIMEAVSNVSGTLRKDRHSPRREAKTVRWRHIEMFLLKSRTNLSFPEIGRRMGGRDHSTVLHGVRKVEANFNQYASDIAKCEALL